ncbi:MAG: TlyA family RNA methyltransferase, partial [Bacteroidales bacterium]|nr:TlyA family RNA methyltransferase [Bacteroidales bacterium]
MDRQRLDIWLVSRGDFLSREKAAEAVKAGVVRVNDICIKKPSVKVDTHSNIEISSVVLPYVSKGGLKLEKGIVSFGLEFRNRTILDVGCSTGGFSDCALQHEAAFVYGIDVGRNQLDKKLQNNPKIKSIENLHVKDLLPEHIDNKKMDGIVIDVSFISLTQTLPHILPFLKEDGFVFVLIKPQFELDSASLNRQGIVQNPKHHQKAIQRVVSCAETCGLFLQAIDYAPLMTYRKNIEYIALFRLTANGFSPNINQ